MAFTLKLRETMEFEEKAGIPFDRVRAKMLPQLCQVHRLARGSCAKCRKDGFCPAHREEMQECLISGGGCDMPALPAVQLAALGWVLKRRTEPDLDWDAYLEEATPEDAWLALGNA